MQGCGEVIEKHLVLNCCKEVVNAKKKEKEIVLVDENYEEQMLLLSNISTEDTKKWLERVGV